MKKLALLAAAIFLCGFAFSQIYVPQYVVIYGQHSNRIRTDSALHIPEKGQTVNTLDTTAQIFYDKDSAAVFIYTRANGFKKIWPPASSSSGTVTSFNAIDGYGVKSTLTSSTTTPTYTPRVDTSVISNKRYVDSSVSKTIYTTAGTSPTFTISPNPPLTAYTAGVVYKIKFNTAPTSSATLNVSGLGAKSLYIRGASFSSPSSVALNTIYNALYDGTNFNITDPGAGVTGNGSLVLSDGATLTGSPLAPTQPSSDNSTRIATTAFVKSQGYLTDVPGIDAVLSQSQPLISDRDINTNGNQLSFSNTFGRFYNSNGYTTTYGDIDNSSTGLVETIDGDNNILSVKSGNYSGVNGIFRLNGEDATWSIGDASTHSLNSSISTNGSVVSYKAGDGGYHKFLDKLVVNTVGPGVYLSEHVLANESGLYSFDNDAQIAAFSLDDNIYTYDGGSYTFNVSDGVHKFTDGGLLLDNSIQNTSFGAGALTTDASGNFIVTSDRRLKNIISKSNVGLKEIMKLNPVNYKYNGISGYDTCETYTGFIAQNVKANIPNSTGTAKIKGKEYLSLQDRAILAAAVNAIKDQQKEIEDIKKQILKLKKQIK